MKYFLEHILGWSILAAILFMCSTFLWRLITGSIFMDSFFIGFPLNYYHGTGLCPPGETCTEFNSLNLVLDFIFWLIVSPILFEVHKRWKIKKAVQK